ncbi:MAG: HU family DNA-binding protein [Tahibacter sp.]
MNKSDLIARIAEETGRPKTETEAYFNSFVAQVANALSTGESVVLAGFGTFEVRSRAERSGRNPRTGEAMTIAASKAAAFKPAAALKKALEVKA